MLPTNTIKVYKIQDLNEFAQKRAFKDWSDFMKTFSNLPNTKEVFMEACVMESVTFTEHGDVLLLN